MTAPLFSRARSSPALSGFPLFFFFSVGISYIASVFSVLYACFDVLLFLCLLVATAQSDGRARHSGAIWPRRPMLMSLGLAGLPLSAVFFFVSFVVWLRILSKRVCVRLSVDSGCRWLLWQPRRGAGGALVPSRAPSIRSPWTCSRYAQTRIDVLSGCMNSQPGEVCSELVCG